jgi:hypothetical protein
VIGHALASWWDDWVNMAIISVVWLLCWITVVLGPPATLGMYHVANRLASGRSLELGGLWEGIKRYFQVSWLWMLLNIVVAVIQIVNFYFWTGQRKWWAILVAGVLLFLSLVWLATQFYALPFLIEQRRKNLGLALRNGLFTALAAPGFTVVVAGLSAVLAVVSFLFVLPLLIGVPMLIAAVGTWAVRDRLETYGVHERDAERIEGDSHEP